MSNLVAIIGALLLAGLGTLFVRWVLARNLPVPPGKFRGLRFVVWWGLSTVIGTGCYYLAAFMSVTFFLGIFDVVGRPSEFWKTVCLFLASTPYWFALAYGIYVQFYRERGVKHAV